MMQPPQLSGLKEVEIFRGSCETKFEMIRGFWLGFEVAETCWTTYRSFEIDRCVVGAKENKHIIDNQKILVFQFELVS